jgi:hypothetical protein
MVLSLCCCFRPNGGALLFVYFLSYRYISFFLPVYFFLSYRYAVLPVYFFLSYRYVSFYLAGIFLSFLPVYFSFSYQYISFFLTGMFPKGDEEGNTSICKGEEEGNNTGILYTRMRPAKYTRHTFFLLFCKIPASTQYDVIMMSFTEPYSTTCNTHFKSVHGIHSVCRHYDVIF